MKNKGCLVQARATPLLCGSRWVVGVSEWRLVNVRHQFYVKFFRKGQEKRGESRDSGGCVTAYGGAARLSPFYLLSPPIQSPHSVTPASLPRFTEFLLCQFSCDENYFGHALGPTCGLSAPAAWTQAFRLSTSPPAPALRPKTGATISPRSGACWLSPCHTPQVTPSSTHSRRTTAILSRALMRLLN